MGAIFGSFWPVHNSRAMSPTTTQQCRPRRHCSVAQDDTNRNIRATEIPNRKEDGSESGLDSALRGVPQMDHRRISYGTEARLALLLIGTINVDWWSALLLFLHRILCTNNR